MSKQDEASKAYQQQMQVQENEQGQAASREGSAKKKKKYTFPEELALTPEELTVLCEQQLGEQQKEAEQERLRGLADLENTKKRLQREKEEFRQYAAENVLADLLPVLDNLDLALSHAPDMEECKDFVMGVDMTRKLFLDTLEKHQLTAVGEPGEEFSPERHEAVGQEPHDSLAPGHIIRVMQRGYILNGRLVRAALVIVSQ